MGFIRGRLPINFLMPIALLDKNAEEPLKLFYFLPQLGQIFETGFLISLYIEEGHFLVTPRVEDRVVGGFWAELL